MSSAFNMGSLSKRIPISQQRRRRGAPFSTPPHDRGLMAAPVGRRGRCPSVRWGGYFTAGKGSPAGRRAPVRLTGMTAAEHPPVADPQRDARGVAVLEQRLGVLARGAEVVAQAGDRDLAVARDEL